MDADEYTELTGYFETALRAEGKSREYDPVLQRGRPAFATWCAEQVPSPS